MKRWLSHMLWATRWEAEFSDLKLTGFLLIKSKFEFSTSNYICGGNISMQSVWSKFTDCVLSNMVSGCIIEHIAFASERVNATVECIITSLTRWTIFIQVMYPWGDLHMKPRLGSFQKVWWHAHTPSTKDFLEWPTPSVSNHELSRLSL